MNETPHKQDEPIRVEPWLNGAIILVLVAAVIAVYQPVRGYEFLNYDDPGYVAENPYVNDGLTRENLVWAFTTTIQTNWQPLVWLSYMLERQPLRPRP